LANARSLPITAAIQARFTDLDFLHDLGDFSLNISGCMNACGHHHIGNIGILGVDKNGQEWYQITLGGAQGKSAALGKVIGPSFSAEQIPDVIEKIVDTFVDYREVEERFTDTFVRIGIDPFKERVYATRPEEVV
jgi:sulfite reductase (NADPH) hemoprotein beta-component